MGLLTLPYASIMIGLASPCQLQCCGQSPTWQPLQAEGPQLYHCVCGKSMSPWRSMGFTPSLVPLPCASTPLSVCYLPSSQCYFPLLSLRLLEQSACRTGICLRVYIPWGLSLAKLTGLGYKHPNWICSETDIVLRAYFQDCHGCCTFTWPTLPSWSHHLTP